MKAATTTARVRSARLAPAERRSPQVVRKAMTAVHSANTTPERILCHALRASGLRFSRASTTLPGTPDVVFRADKLAVFVDGDFWHGRQWRARGFSSLAAQMGRVNNSAYWIKKISGNIARDQRVNRQLRKDGWRVVRIWESAIRRDCAHATTRIHRALEDR